MFGAYSRIIENSAPSFIITKKAETIRKTTKEIRYFYIEQQVIDILIIRNGPNIVITLELPI
jgi:hypothetical protein